MSKHYSPLTVCDHDCEAANGCTMGGVECPDCGCWYCATEIGEEGLCPDCAKARRADAEAEDAEAELDDLCRED